jgi:PKD repeat protein
MKKVTFLTGLIFLSISLLSQNSFLSFDNRNTNKETTMPVRAINDQGVNGLRIEYNFPGSIVSNHEVSERTFHFLNIEGFGKLYEVGKPALPAHNDFVSIPNGAEASVDILSIEYKEFDNYLIHPALQLATDTHGDPEPEFEIDEDFYNTDILYPENPVRIDEILEYRGNSIAKVKICPVQYNPLKRKIRVISKIVYEVKFSHSESFFGQRSVTENFAKIFPNIILNAKSVKDEITTLIKNKTQFNKDDERADFIIVTKSGYNEAAQALANWKMQLGYATEIVSQDVWTSDEVKEAIHSRYEVWDPKPDYFVILGDHQDVPGQIEQSPDQNDFSTDLYFACMDGTYDYVPDMAHGRISVNNADQANMVIQKIIDYERNPVEDASFYENGLNCAYFQDDENNGYATRRFAHTSENIRDYVMSQGFSVERIYTTPSNINPRNYNNGYYSNGEPIPTELLRASGYPWNGGTQDIISAINEGKFYVFHRDHGYAGGTGWADPHFVTSQMGSLTNGNKLPVVFSINCHTGEFLLNECFAEKFIRLEKAGAVGVFAASYYSYSGLNDGLALGFVDAIWSNPGLIPVFGSGGVPNPNLTPHNDLVTMGDVLNQGLIRMMETWDGGYNANKYTHQLFHYFGDPAMKIWTDVPIEITATNTDTIILDETTKISITNCSLEDGLASLLINGELLGKTELVNGEGEIEFPSTIGNYAILTISKHNYRPYIDTIPIFGTPVPEFTVSNTSTCDGIIDFTDLSLINPNSWSWDFGDGNSSMEQNPSHVYQTNGLFDIKLVVSNDYGTDSIVKTEYISVNRPEAPLTVSAERCDIGSLELSATGSGILNWYSEEFGDEIINVGETFLTPELNETTSYYVENLDAQINYVGKEDNSGLGDYCSAGGLIFDTYLPVKIVSVKVYANGAGDREFLLFDEDFIEITSTTVYLEDGENRIELNFDVPEGEGYKIYGDVGSNLFYNSAGFSYPYLIENIMSITESSYTPAPETKYYFLYDWEVESYSCNSVRSDVTATINYSPLAGFEIENNDPTISFINISVDAETYFWDLGDGETSNEENPVHTYLEDDDYNVSLIASNQNCSDTTIQLVVIGTTGIENFEGVNGLELYPNPATEMINISFESTRSQVIKFSIIDLYGRKIWSKNVRVSPGNYNESIDLDKYSKGVYYICIQSEKGKLTKKLIIK